MTRNQQRHSPKFDTIAVHGAYSADEAKRIGSVIEPIHVSTSQAFSDSGHLEEVLAYRTPGWAYSRIHNPTIGYLEATLALLEAYGSSATASAMATSSGMSAIKQAIEPLVARKNVNDVSPIDFVSSAQIYGGTFQLFNVRMPERGVRPRFVTAPDHVKAWRDAITPGMTRFVYVEVPSNPHQGMVDLPGIAEIAHEFGIPLVVDATLATPVLLRPFMHGADIVVHSLTKTIGASGTNTGGAIIARHGLVADDLSHEQRKDYAAWLKLLPGRDSGPCMSPQTAHAFLSELRTIRSRMRSLSENAQRVAEWLSGHPKVAHVDYLGLPTHRNNELARKFMRLVDDGKPLFGHLLSFELKGGIAETRAMVDRFRLIMLATDLGRIKSIATIPAISTHQQQGEAGRCLANVSPKCVRLCVGGEDPTDVIADLSQAIG
jgi:O-acetylhomoserine (thiol)-lyase